MATARGYSMANGGGTMATAEPQYATSKTSVWWDIENCAVPKGLDPYSIAQAMRSALLKVNHCGPLSIYAYGDTGGIPLAVQQALNSTGIGLNHVPSGAKDASDKKILVDMLLWAVENPSPANIMLISGDRDFSNALHQLRMKGYNILLAQPQQASTALIHSATTVWKWASIAAGGLPLTRGEISQLASPSVQEDYQKGQSGQRERGPKASNQPRVWIMQIPIQKNYHKVQLALPEAKRKQGKKPSNQPGVSQASTLPLPVQKKNQKGQSSQLENAKGKQSKKGHSGKPENAKDKQCKKGLSGQLENAKEKQCKEGQSGQPEHAKGKQPTKGQSGQPKDAKGKQPTKGQAGQPKDAKGKQPKKGQSSQPKITIGKQSKGGQSGHPKSAERKQSKKA